MRLKLTLVTAAALYSLCMTSVIAAETLTIAIHNVTTAEGTIMVQVMAGEAEFKGEQPPIASIMRRAREGNMTISTSNLPAGEYAIRVMHDVNGNGELDSNFVGMPTEPWAMSNNAKGNFGPPRWPDVRFTLDGDVTQTLNLN